MPTPKVRSGHLGRHVRIVTPTGEERTVRIIWDRGNDVVAIDDRDNSQWVMLAPGGRIALEAHVFEGVQA